jgi:hypothetical protein|tara:strand:+ start:4353 stop:4622 length:270 start_codon:yes stop_codon:yes gene_type:complete
MKPMRGKNIMTKLRSKQVLTDEEVKIFIDKECKLLTSKQLAEVLNVSDGALRKQRSKGKSIFPYANINGRIFYPTDVIVKKIHNNLVGV